MAPKGNKNAVGNEGGRPEKYDAIALAESLDVWSKKETSVNLVGFCLEQDICDYTVYDLEDRSTEFSKSLRIARMRLSERRDALACKGALPTEMWKRYADSFDPFLKKHEKEKKQFESDLKKQENATDALPADLLQKMDVLMKMKTVQERKIEENNINEDKKS